MKRSLSLLILLFITANSVYSQISDNKLRARAYLISAMEHYENGNYDKVLEYCTNIENYLDDVDAEVEALRVKSYYALEEYSKAKISLDLFLRLDSEEALKQEMFLYIVEIDERIYEDDRDYNEAKDSKSIPALQAYLSKYKKGRYRVDAQKLLDRLTEDAAWDKATTAGTIEAYKEYIIHYPSGKYVSIATETIASIDKDGYLTAIEENTQESLSDYLRNFPHGEYVREIEDKLAERIEYDTYMRAKHSGLVEHFEEYVRSYPEGKYASDANNEIELGYYNLGNTAFDNKDFQKARGYFSRYALKFPEGLYISEVLKKLKKAERKTK